jgi:HSP20 family protein
MNDTQVAKQSTATGKEVTREKVTMTPAVDVVEDATGITLYADLPGVPKDKLALNVEADTLTIEGEVDLKTPEGVQALHIEVEQPHYRRVFTLSRELDSEKIAAEFKQGVLKLHIPKVAQPRKINVAVH